MRIFFSQARNAGCPGTAYGNLDSTNLSQPAILFPIPRRAPQLLGIPSKRSLLAGMKGQVFVFEVAVPCFYASQGFTNEEAISSKCLALRVASFACEASTIPAIMVSRSSPGRPILCLSAANSAARRAAASS